MIHFGEAQKEFHFLLFCITQGLIPADGHTFDILLKAQTGQQTTCLNFTVGKEQPDWAKAQLG